MDSLGLIVVIFLGLLLAPLALTLLQQILPLIRTRLVAALPRFADVMRKTFRWAGHLVSEDGELSPSRAVAQITGSFLMIAAGVVFALSDLQLTLATLGPLFGINVNGAIFTGFHELLGLSVVLLAVVFGLVITDLLGWTFVTRFAVIERARASAFCIALLCFLLSLAEAIALAAYRLPGLMFDGTNMSADEVVAWVQSLPPLILLPLAALLFVGALFAFMSLETFFSAIVASLTVAGGLGLGTVWLILGVVDLLLELTAKAAETLHQSIAPFVQASRTGLRSAGAGFAKGTGNIGEKFRTLVRPAAPKGAKVTDQAAGPKPAQEPTVQPRESATSQPQAEEPAQQANLNGSSAHP